MNKPPANASHQQQIQALQEEVARLKDFSELSSDWYWEQDANLCFTGFSGMSPEMLRRKQSDFIGRRRWDMSISGVSPEELAAHIRCCMAHKAFHEFEYDILSAQGEVQRFSISGRPVFDAEGEFCGYRGVGRNITNLHKAEQAVRDSEQKLAQIIAGSAVPIFVINCAHQITHWNLACENITGVNASEVLGHSAAWKGFYGASRPTLADLVIDKATQETLDYYYEDKYSPSSLIPGAYEAESFFPHMINGGRWLYFTAAPLLDGQGNTIGAIETLQDITAKKEAESAEREHWQSLQEAHAELQSTLHQLVQAKKLAALGRLVAGVAHELNTPIGNALMGSTSLQLKLQALDQSCNDNTLSRSHLETFRSECHQIIDLLNDSLNRCGSLIRRFRELANDRRQDRYCTYSPEEIITEVLGLFGKQIDSRNVVVSSQIESHTRLTGYPEAFAQIISILLENSLIHGVGSAGNISIKAQQETDQVKFEYKDDGRGMDAETIAHAFDPFFSTQFGQGESGLGLYRAFNLVTVILGGKIDLSSELGKGVTVTLTLPNEAPENISD
ncbi:PAS domain-containing sensor histidine kinase [Motiliproteus sp. MSK22-1]|uniref:PAS domain-containing sensor histidine kinase n=1 Tax=Motiliproteus sp. MSK22-1 TaxID=1897630 RepID=UPI000977DE07|nr:PAS domain-containing sensor histidine kinase [Motiliproteus sp. MSK22-1]OMH30791.1 hypothetical protein BGP75_17345 [Motiliproteus sp. MSK22-1]